MVHPYGSWPSPISAQDAVAGSVLRSLPRVAGETVLWVEQRPDDDGRASLLRGGIGVPPEVVSAPGADVRTRYQEYGGGDVAVADDLVLLVDFSDQRVRRLDRAEPVTPESQGRLRWSCLRVDPRRGVAYGLREDQRDPSAEPVTSLVRIDLDGPNDDGGVELVAGRRRPVDVDAELPADVGSPPDFVADPALSPDGERLAWVSWNHPNMPWNGAWLWTARLDDAGDLREVVLVAGAEDEVVEQPTWLPDGRLVFLSDRTGFSNLHVAQESSDGWRVEPLGPRDDHDHGLPRWRPDMSSYAVLPDGRVVACRWVDGLGRLVVLDAGAGSWSEVPHDATAYDDLRALGEHHVVAVTAYADRPAGLVAIDVRDGAETVLSDADPAPDPAWVSRPEPVSWAGSGGETTYGFLYPPANPHVTAPAGAPPVRVTMHGGPTGMATAAWRSSRSYWTSRGFAVLDVNYGGSAGFGRAYRERLEGRWGVVDVEDAALGVAALGAQGRVDGARAVIMGGSAGGFTTLAALCFTDAFAAGTSLFGVSDLAALARETHKLESRYLWRLVAPWPEGEAVYAERSPIHHVDRLRTPLLLLQGTDDRVVPPNQAQLMADALRERGLPVALVMFEGEGHGFRVPANLVRTTEIELSFYGQVLGFTPAGELAPLEVENL